MYVRTHTQTDMNSANSSVGFCRKMCDQNWENLCFALPGDG